MKKAKEGEMEGKGVAELATEVWEQNLTKALKPAVITCLRFHFSCFV